MKIGVKCFYELFKVMFVQAKIRYLSQVNNFNVMVLKHIIFSAVLFMAVNSTHAQDDSSKSTTIGDDIFLVFDSLYDPVKKRTYEADSLPNFLQVVNTEGVIVYNIRNYKGFLEGEVQDIKTETLDDAHVTSFYILGKNRSNGVRMSLEIKEFANGTYQVHYYRKLGGKDCYFKAHRASEKEIARIQTYFK